MSEIIGVDVAGVGPSGARQPQLQPGAFFFSKRLLARLVPEAGRQLDTLAHYQSSAHALLPFPEITPDRLPGL